MAYIHVEYYSKALRRVVPVNVFLPVDNETEAVVEKPYRTIYLLHGLTQNCSEWLTYSRIREWSVPKGLAVVMPSGENSFYVDSYLPNHNYGQFIGEELVNVTRDMFCLSDKREDTFIGGLSMGGYGAIRNGLKYHETFSRIIALSSAIHFFETPLGQSCDNLFHEESCFGDLEQAHKSDKNPRVLVKKLLEDRNAGARVSVPKIYMACGTEDNLITANRSFYEFLKENFIEVSYTEESGCHDWDFWNKHILKALDWIDQK